MDRLLVGFTDIPADEHVVALETRKSVTCHVFDAWFLYPVFRNGAPYPTGLQPSNPEPWTMVLVVLFQQTRLLVQPRFIYIKTLLRARQDDSIRL
jgi:hypothetical protein